MKESNVKNLLAHIFMKNGKAVTGLTNFQILGKRSIPELAKYYEHKGADALILFDLAESEEEHRLHQRIIKCLCSRSQIPILAGGHIDDIRDMEELMNMGCDKIFLNMSKEENREILHQAQKQFGKEHIAVCINDFTFPEEENAKIEKYADEVILLGDNRHLYEAVRSLPVNCIPLMDIIDYQDESVIRLGLQIIGLPHIHLLTDEDAVRQQVYETDPGKLVIAADGWNGHEVAEFLRRKEHLEVEMEAAGYVIALTSIADTDEGFKRLKNALIHIEENISTNSVEDEEKQPQKNVSSNIRSLSGTSDNEGKTAVLSIAQATACEHMTMDLERSIGEISGEYIYLYPPGIPLVVPGERITEELLCQIREVRQTGLEIQGMRDYSGKKVDVCRKV